MCVSAIWINDARMNLSIFPPVPLHLTFSGLIPYCPVGKQQEPGPLPISRSDWKRLVRPRHQGANPGGNQDEGGDAENQHVAANMLATGGVGDADRNRHRHDRAVDVVQVIEAGSRSRSLA